MKVSIEVDCTPEEARAFFGLPDVRHLQESMLSQMQAQMQKAAANMDPETTFKALFPLQSDSFTEMQKAFWGQFAGQFTGKSDK